MTGPTEFPNWPPRFVLDQERILALLTGDRFYTDSSAALREAVLNALDAVHRRRATGGEIAPQVLVSFNMDDSTLTVADNGDGMGETEITSLFARVGASAASLSVGKGSVGEFGIGVISYFMVCDSFSIDTLAQGNTPIALRFTKDMLHGAPAEELVPSRGSVGTTLVLHLKSSEVLTFLTDRFSHWCRNVNGLTAQLLPEERDLPQGGTREQLEPVTLTTPRWVERANLAPVADPKGWGAMTGESTVSVLYRGIFVQDFTVKGAWGIRGSIDVDPKQFKPRLNREGFVEGEFKRDVEAFLRQAHPAILVAMARHLQNALSKGLLDSWAKREWATLWLSIPRTGDYADATVAWDRVFRAVPAFELAKGNDWELVSLERLVTIREPIYVAPLPPEEKKDAIIGAALRLLRNTGRPVVRGLRRDPSWMRDAGNSYGTTADLIQAVFAGELPALLPLSQHANNVINATPSVVKLYSGPPSVDLVRLGADSPPALRLQERLVINIDNPAGTALVMEAIDQNVGPIALVVGGMRHAYEQLQQIAAVVRDIDGEPEILGLVKRRVVRGCLS